MCNITTNTYKKQCSIYKKCILFRDRKEIFFIYFLKKNIYNKLNNIIKNGYKYLEHI